MGAEPFRRLVLVAALCAALAGAVGACSPVPLTPPATVPSAASGAPTGGSATPGAPTPARPDAALAAAVARTAETSWRLQLGNAHSKGTGAYDPVSRGSSYVMVVDNGSTVTLLSFGIDVYVIGLADASGQILHFDVTRFALDSSMLLMSDPVLALRLLPTASGVERTGRGFRGVLDLGRVDAAGYPADKMIADSLVAGMGGRSSGIGFEVEVDDQGRLTRFRTTFAGADDGHDIEYELLLSEFGTPERVTKPVGADIAEAPDELYRG